MLHSFLQEIKKHALMEKGDKLLLAVSGGVDSMVLWNLVDQSGFNYTIAHCNFGLRGQESDQDEAFIRQMAESFAADLYVKQFDVSDYRSDKVISTQMAARDLRYEWFDQLLKKEGFDKLLTAHHLNDNIETVLLNQIRGTSILGLSGIPYTNGRLVRPLLSFSKSQLLDYAKTVQLQWREDSSNEKTDYRRNYVRHEVVPKLEALTPGFLNTFSINIEKNREVESIFKSHIEQLKLQLIRSESHSFSLSIEELVDHKVGPLVLQNLLSDFGFNYTQCTDVLESLNKTGARFESRTHRMWIDRSFVYIEVRNEKEKEERHYVNDWEGLKPLLPDFTIGILKRPFVLDKDSDNAMLDLDLLEFPLVLRPWRHGDRFRPLGMSNEKLISDFLIDLKVPNHVKSRIQIIESVNEIVCVLGLRISEKFKVTSGTKKVLYLSRTHD